MTDDRGAPTGPAPEPPASPRRELRLALVLVLAGAALVLLAAGRDWVDVALPRRPPLPDQSVTRTGNDVAAALSPLALLGLAGVAALAATRRLGRVLLGALLAVAGLAVAVVTARTLAAGVAAAVHADRPGVPVGADAGFSGWPLLALAGGVLLALGGLLVAVRGRRWAALSARYEVPAARADRPPARPEVAAWDALDRGEDPTGPGPGAGPTDARP